jgi:hypothetical protein
MVSSRDGPGSRPCARTLFGWRASAPHVGRHLGISRFSFLIMCSVQYGRDH